MHNSKTARKLQRVEECLRVANASLVALDAPAAQWANTLSQAAALLESIHAHEITPPEGLRIRQSLSHLTAQVATAKTLLDSAASLYFGCVLSQGAVDRGYLADGASGAFGGGCLQIHG